jgi:hypothetical protein
VADCPRALDFEVVENRDRVFHVRLDRVRRTWRGGRRTTLRVTKGLEETIELVGEGTHVVGQTRAPVQKQRGQTVSGTVPDEAVELELSHASGW